MSGYIVWIGGVNENDTPLSFDKAKEIYDEYVGLGYDDVLLEEVTECI